MQEEKGNGNVNEMNKKTYMNGGKKISHNPSSYILRWCEHQNRAENNEQYSIFTFKSSNKDEIAGGEQGVGGLGEWTLVKPRVGIDILRKSEKHIDTLKSRIEIFGMSNFMVGQQTSETSNSCQPKY